MSRSVTMNYERYRAPSGSHLSTATGDTTMPQPEISPTRFTPDELKLISRALNTTSFTDEIKAAKNLASRIYRENFRIGMDNEPPLYYKDTDSLQDILDHVSPPPPRNV